MVLCDSAAVKMGSDDDGIDEELDPRVEGALGELNSATDDINKSEKDLEASKKAFKNAMNQVQIDLAQLVQKVGKKSIDKARPYHMALYKARKAHYEARRAAQAYEQASGSQKKSKTLVASLEAELMKGGKFDPVLQKKLNQATQSVMEADKRKRKAAEAHSRTTQAFLEADEELMTFAKTRKKVILKTQPYFSSKEKHDKILMQLKDKLLTHENGVKSAKARVAAALKQLEDISMEIHENRKKRKEDNAASDTVSQAIAEAQADAVRREKAEQERIQQEEAERKAAEEAAAAEAAAAEASAQADLETADAEDSEKPDGDDGVAAAGNAALDVAGGDDAPNTEDGEDDDDDISASADVSDEDLRKMIQTKLEEHDELSIETPSCNGEPEVGATPAKVDSDGADGVGRSQSPQSENSVDDDAADPITV